WAAVSGAVVARVRARGGLALVQSDRLVGDMIADLVPNWVADLALPIGFGLIAVRLVWRASPLWSGRAIASLGIVAGLLLNHYRALLENQALWPWLLVLL